VGVVGIGAAGAASQAPGVLPGEPNVPWDDGAIPAQARTDLADVHPRTWQHILLAPDGRTATVYFAMGPEACEALASIEVAAAEPGYRILVMTGQVPDAPAECQAVEPQLYRSVVVLDDRLVTGGGLLDLPGGHVGSGA
jgi:hypothetical protein